MKTKIILSLIICFVCFSAFAQEDSNHGLVLRGRVFEGTHENFDDHFIWRAKLAMVFVNTGKESIIIINPGQDFRNWQSEATFSWMKDKNAEENFLFTKKVERPQGSAEELGISAQFLDTKEPPQNLVLILRPGESFNFEDVLEVKQKFSTDRFGSYSTWEGSGSGSAPVSALHYLFLKYEFSLVKYRIDPDLLEKLQARWRKFGVIPIDTNGGFSITSEVISTKITYKEIKKERK